MSLSTGRFCPVGETDSEYAFCLLLERLLPLLFSYFCCCGLSKVESVSEARQEFFSSANCNAQ